MDSRCVLASHGWKKKSNPERKRKCAWKYQLEVSNEYQLAAISIQKIPISMKLEDTTLNSKTGCPQEWYEWAQTALFTYCMSTSLSQTPRSFACVPGMFGALNKHSALFCLIAKIWQASKPFFILWNPQWTQRACRDSTFRGPPIHHGGFTLKGWGLGRDG